MYDSYGRYVAKYHKYYLYNSEFPLFNIDKEPQNIYVDTSFGKFKYCSLHINFRLDTYYIFVYIGMYCLVNTFPFFCFRSPWINNLRRFTVVLSYCRPSGSRWNRHSYITYRMVGRISSSPTPCYSRIMGWRTSGKFNVFCSISNTVRVYI